MAISGVSAYSGYSGYTNYTNANTGISSVDGEKKHPVNPDEVKKNGKRSSPAECETCKNRKYKDGSDENVSFKAATHVSPQASGAAVRSHEAEHVSNAYTKAAKDNGQVLSVGVTIQTAVCPECGSVYTAGGETRTVIKYSDESNPYQQNQKSLDALKYVGANVDYAA
ncbi:MAG: hypothetical protein NC307_01320 [Roseburia sp.]|nr:hypothetical protein [Roseburia sp.]